MDIVFYPQHLLETFGSEECARLGLTTEGWYWWKDGRAFGPFATEQAAKDAREANE